MSAMEDEAPSLSKQVQHLRRSPPLMKHLANSRTPLS